jgi:hypothetical protein
VSDKEISDEPLRFFAVISHQLSDAIQPVFFEYSGMRLRWVG